MARGASCAVFLVLFVVTDDFLNDEFQEFLGEFRVEIGPFRKIFEARDLGGFAGRIGRGQIVFGFQPAHGLRVLEPFAQRVDQDRVKPVDAFAML